MKIRMFTLATMAGLQLAAQKTAADSTEQALGYYRLAVQYKDGTGVPVDYAKAVNYFTESSKLGDPQSVYALGYMHYKGLGCAQDYNLAATLFKKGAMLGKDNSMYFYGLCWRNGYGVSTNEDSAKYWLQKSASLGYRQATQELQMAGGENSNEAAKKLVQQIRNAALPGQTTVNKYRKISNHLPPGEVFAGQYSGYIIQYDWSGRHTVSNKKLTLNIHGQRNNMEGFWKEEDMDSIPLKATLVNDSIIFKNTAYRRKDHYSPDTAIRYNFQNASLNLVQKNDTVFLAGNISMFSPDRKEPSKPLLVALSRTDPSIVEKDLHLRASPSPFGSVLNVEFTLPKQAVVEVQLLSVAGAVIYRNPAGKLDAGHYLLPLQPGVVAPGVYVVKLVYGGKSVVVNVVKG